MVQPIPIRSVVLMAACAALAAGACSTSKSSPETGGTAGASSGGSTSGTGATSMTASSSGTGASTSSSSGAGAGTADAGTPNAAKTCSPETAAVEQYHLPPVPAPPANVSFTTDWSQIPATGGWYGEQIMDACRMHPDGFTTWHGKAAVRVEVDPGDDPLFLGENSERAEMLFTQSASGQQVNEEVTGGDQFYAMSYYFPTTWAGTFYPWSVIEAQAPIDCSTGSQTQCNSWSHVMQLHTASAFWGALSAGAKTVGGPQTFWLTLGSTYPFSDGGAIPLGSWTDFVLEIDWSTGAIALWRRDEGKSAFTQVVSATESTVTTVSGVYLKQGLYRGGYVQGRTDVFWIGPTAKGTSFSAVELRAFGTSAGP
jgi:hypothetical protein